MKHSHPKRPGTFSRKTGRNPFAKAEGQKRFYGSKPQKPSAFKGKADARSDGEKPAHAGKSFHVGKPAFGDKRHSSKSQGPKQYGPKKFHGPKRNDLKRHDLAAAPVVVRGVEKPRDGVLIWGLHAVRAAWLNPKRRCFRLWLTEAGHEAFAPSIAEAKDNLLKRPDIKKADRNELDRLTPPGSVHQGILLEVAPLHEPALHEVISGDNPPELLLMLDQVTDPHNVGAILRSAAAFGAGAVIMTERNAPIMTGVQAKAASGALEHVHQVHVVNLARALDELQEAGYWRIGLAEEGEKDIGDLDLSGRTVLVLGAEGEGLRQLTKKKCDELSRLPTGGAISSLNVSNAAAVALYEVRRQKKRF